MPNQTDEKKIDLEKLPTQELVRDLDSGQKFSPKKKIGIGVTIVILGIVSGYLLTTITGKSNTTLSPGKSGTVSSGKTVGSADTKTFPDSAEGQLEVGGINGEGTHKLIRPGGESQTVYLTSSVLDLNEFVGKKVKVWGQTYSAKKAGWLMDVGRVEVL